MKRIVSMLCVFCVLICTLPVLAENAVTVTGEDAFVKKGNYTDYSVGISNNTGISAYIIYVDCDTNVFSVDYDENDESYKVQNGTSFNSGTIACNKNGNKGYVVSWYLGNGSVKKDGELFRLKFLANENAATGKYPIKIRYSDKNTLNADMEKIPLNCVDGSITVAPETAHFYVEDAEAVPGETFNLKIKTDSNPGLASYMVYILLDTKAFNAIYDEDLSSYEVIDGDISQSGTIMCNSYSNKGYRIVWYSPNETVREGTMFELPLKVFENTALGDYNIQIKITSSEITDERGNKVPTTLSDGTITVKDFVWKGLNVRCNEQNQTALVDITPCVSCKLQNICLYAAVYDESGKMLSLASDRINEVSESHFFTLDCYDSEKSKIKLFAWEADTLNPICEPLTIQMGN